MSWRKQDKRYDLPPSTDHSFYLPRLRIVREALAREDIMPSIIADLQKLHLAQTGDALPESEATKLADLAVMHFVDDVCTRRVRWEELTMSSGTDNPDPIDLKKQIYATTAAAVMEDFLAGHAPVLAGRSADL